MSARSIGGKGFRQYWKVLYCQNSSLSWCGAAPQSPRGVSARPAPLSPPPLGGRAAWSSSPGLWGRRGGGGCSRGGSLVSQPRPSRSAPPGAPVSPPSWRLLGEAEGSVIAPASTLRFRGSAGTLRGCPRGEAAAAAAAGIQSGRGGGSSGNSQSRSRFQGTWNVSGSAARRLAMGPGGSGGSRPAREAERRLPRRAGGPRVRGRARTPLGPDGGWKVGRQPGRGRGGAAGLPWAGARRPRRRGGGAGRWGSNRRAAEIRTCALT